MGSHFGRMEGRLLECKVKYDWQIGGRFTQKWCMKLFRLPVLACRAEPIETGNSFHSFEWKMCPPLRQGK